MIALRFPKLSCFARENEICTIATPHPQGALKDAGQIGVFGGNGAVMSQSKPTALWPDGSIKWLFTVFAADLPANKGTDEYRIEMKAGDFCRKNAAKASKGADGRVVVETGALTLTLGEAGEAMIQKAVYEGGSFTEGEIASPSLKILDNEYAALVGKDGWEIVEAGPVRALLLTKGKHVGPSGEMLDFHLYIHAYAGKPYVQVEYRFINCEADSASVNLTKMQMSVSPKTKGTACVIGRSNYATQYIRSEGEPISHLIDSTYLKYVSNEQVPEINFGTYFADWRDENRGLCVTMFQAFQNFPKGFEACSDGINAQLIPEQWGEIEVFRGIAKTHKMLLHFHCACESAEDLGFRSLQYNMPDKPVIDWTVYRDAGLFGDFLGEKRQMNVELFIKSMGEGTARTYGMLHWGDAPDIGYTSQGRARGDYVWTNNEYDYPHQCMIEYARTGNRYYLDRLIVAAEHWRDVDVCKSSDDPHMQNGMIAHTKNHVLGHCTPSHEWVEGLWDYYHMTGDEYAREVVMGIAENVRLVLVDKIFPLERYTAAREAGWALRTFCAMYNELYDEKWLEFGDRIVNYFVKWTEDYGAWLQPYTAHTMVRVPFMIAVASVSLCMYYSIRPSDKLKNLVLSAMDDVLENCYTYDGSLYYKELPSLQRSGTNPIVMHALVLCHQLSGDKKYLEAGLEFFKLDVFYGRSRGREGMGKIDRKDSVVNGGASPKAFAQSYPCIAAFYKAAMDNDMLPKEFATMAPWLSI